MTCACAGGGGDIQFKRHFDFNHTFVIYSNKYMKYLESNYQSENKVQLSAFWRTHYVSITYV